MSISVQTKKYAILFHRWLGVAFCLLFALWFVSGIVMMYWTFPEITQREALARAAVLESAQVKLSPAEAFAKLQPADDPTRVALESLDGRPIYRFAWGRDETSVWADTGESLDEVTGKLARSVAALFTGQPAALAHFDGRITEADQWTIQSNYRPHMPLLKYSWPDGEEVYISSTTGEAVQHSTRGSRIAAYFGAIPHWLYFLPLRRKVQLWNDVVVWSSGIGAVMSLLGIGVGLWLYSPSKRYRFPDGARSVPYTGQKRWHTILGLLFGLFVCTWAFSGMMSMGPFDLRTTGPGPKLSAALRGRFSVDSYSLEGIRKALAALPGAKQLDLSQLAGTPHMVARTDADRSLVVPVSGAPFALFAEAEVAGVLRRAASPIAIREVRRVDAFEAYYVSRHGEAPLPALFVQLDNPEGSMYYVDLHTARMVSAYSTQSRLNRWLYHGLHSLDFPILYKYRPLWDIVVLTLMLGGTALCVTSVVIGWRRLKRKAIQLAH